MRAPALLVRCLRSAITTIAFLGLIEAIFTPPANLMLFAVANGALYGLAAIGVVLIYRTHRVINFAGLAMGTLPAVTVALLQVMHDLPYWPALLLALAGGALLGGAVDVIVIRRFARMPRLILTIATLAVVQVTALGSERIAARIVSDRAVPSRVPTPWRGLRWLDSRGTPLFTGDHLAAIVVVLLVVGALTAFLRLTRAGVAIRAAADNDDRAHLLGIPVRRLHTAAWAIAGLIAATVVFFRIPLVGVPLDPTLGPEVTLYVIAAAVVARLESLPVAAAAGIGIGILEQASVARIGSGDLASALMLAVLLAALLVRGAGEPRDRVGIASWIDPTEPVVLPRAVRRLPQVRVARGLATGVVVASAIAAPYIVTPGQLSKLTLVPLTALVGVSLVVLTGWAGHVSLGQFAFAGAGAAVAGGLAANQGADFFVALAAGVVVGALVAVLVGLPAARLQGIYLAVTTLAFAAAMEFYFLKKTYPVHRLLLPHGEAPRVERPVLYGIVDLTSDRALYFVAVGFLGLGAWLARSFRRSRSGRVVLAARENPDAAAAYGVNVRAARLWAFALSGALAGLAGVLFAYQQGSVDPGTFGVAPSLQVFLMTVLGGIASPMGAVLGATVLKSVQFFVEPHFRGASLLFEGPLLLVALLVNPGGMSAGLYRARDRLVSRLVASRPTPAEPTPPMAIAAAAEPGGSR